MLLVLYLCFESGNHRICLKTLMNRKYTKSPISDCCFRALQNEHLKRRSTVCELLLQCCEILLPDEKHQRGSLRTRSGESHPFVCEFVGQSNVASNKHLWSCAETRRGFMSVLISVRLWTCPVFNRWLALTPKTQLGPIKLTDKQGEHRYLDKRLSKSAPSTFKHAFLK